MSMKFSTLVQLGRHDVTIEADTFPELMKAAGRLQEMAGRLKNKGYMNHREIDGNDFYEFVEQGFSMRLSQPKKPAVEEVPFFIYPQQRFVKWDHERKVNQIKGKDGNLHDAEWDENNHRWVPVRGGQPSQPQERYAEQY